MPSGFGNAMDRENAEGIFAIKQSVHCKLKELNRTFLHELGLRICSVGA